MSEYNPFTVRVGGQDVDAARLLAALHNHTKAFGWGLLQDVGRDLTLQEAAEDLVKLGITSAEDFRFDYYRGRPLKVSTDSNGVMQAHCERLFDRDAGEGSYRRAVKAALSS